MRCRKVLSVAFSAMLAVSLCPMPAFAAPLEAGSANAKAAPAQVTTQAKAKKKTVWVVDKIKESTAGNAQMASSSSTIKYAYNSNGLLTKRSLPSVSFKYSYDKNNVLNKVSGGGAKMTFEITKGKRTKGTLTQTGSVPKIVEEYTYAGSDVSKVKTTEWYVGFPAFKMTKQKPITRTYTRDGNGLCTKLKLKLKDGSRNRTTTYSYKYDKKKNLISSKCSEKYAHERTYKNTYDANGRLSRVVETTVMKDYYGSSSYTTTYKISYRQVKVDSKFAKTIEDQQWAIVNGLDVGESNTNFALGGVNPR